MNGNQPDIVQRLRDCGAEYEFEAADEIERLRKERDELKEFLNTSHRYIVELESLREQLADQIAGNKAMSDVHWKEMVKLKDELTALRAKIAALQPVAWNGGKKGREWTTDKEVADKWVETYPQQAMPLYDLEGLK